MPGLKSIRRASEYKLGGITTLLGWATKTAGGIAQASVDKATGAFTLAPGADVFRFEFEENTCMYSDNTVFNVNRYPKHIVGMQLAGRTDDLNEVAKTFDLTRNSFAVKTFTGENLVIGMSNGLVAEKDDSGAGATTEGFNGFDIVLSGGETTKAIIISDADFAALAGRVV